MTKIKTLPKELIAKIAAGEVVEGPASVVKELVENSIDAGARNIKIDIEEGGFRRISVVDDGAGMSRDDLVNAVKLHATSKIRETDDLWNISSLGFRGEALASISSVSDFYIKSKDEMSEIGYELKVDYGEEPMIRETAMNRGTVIDVKNLFSKTPARLKFMKTKSYEFRKVAQVVSNIALIFPEISLRLYHNGKEIMNFLGKSDMKTRVSEIFGREIRSHLLDFEHEGPYLNINGFLGRPQIAGNSNKRQLIFINNRAVRHPLISRKIKDTYASLLAPREQPTFVLFLTLPNQNIDVNIHPRKEEVKLLNQKEMLSQIEEAVQKTLESHDLRYYLDGETEETDYDLHSAQILKDKSNLWTVKEKDYTKSEIIQLHNTYLITETEEGIMMIDQHAAHERILVEELREIYKNLEDEIYELPEAISFEMHQIEADFLKENLAEFLRLGFNIEEFGQNIFKITSVPIFFKNRKLVNLIYEVLDDIRLEREPLGLDYKTERTLAYLACRTAIKAGEYLEMDERRRLLDKLQKTKLNYTCPHGRPSHIELSKKEIETLFKRR